MSKAREIIRRVENLLTQVDSKASVPLRLSRSTGEATVRVMAPRLLQATII